MADDLRATLERSVPPTSEPDLVELWARGRALRRRDRIAVAAGAVLATVVIAAGVGVVRRQPSSTLVATSSERGTVASDGVASTAWPPTSLDQTLPGVTAVSFGGGFNVRLRSEKGEGRLAFRGSAAALEQVVVEVASGSLQVTRDRSDNSSDRCEACDEVVDVQVELADVVSIAASGGARIALSGFTTTVDRQAHATGGAAIGGTLNARDLRVDAVGGSRVELRGQAARVDVTATGGADVELGNFDADIAAVDGSGGGSVRVRVHHRLEHCTAVGGTNVRYTGSPALGKVTTSAGGTCNPA
jgi:hypothetical protein